MATPGVALLLPLGACVGLLVAGRVARSLGLVGGGKGRPAYAASRAEVPGHDGTGLESLGAEAAAEDFCPPHTTAVVPMPSAIDAVVRDARSRGATVYVLVTAAMVPFAGVPWCPDSRRAEPLIRERLLRHHPDPAAGGGVTLVLARVKRYAYMGNPGHPYRTHPQLRLQSCPTLYGFRPDGSLWSVVEADCYDESRLDAAMSGKL